MNSKEFNLAFGNSQGLINDAQIISEALTELFGPTIKIRKFSGKNGKLKNLLNLLYLIVNRFLFSKEQITIHLEEIYTEISPFSNTNIFIPNQEWLRSKTQKAITPNTYIWCKTHYAVKQLAHLNDKVSYIGFCSRDMNIESIHPNFDKFIHIAGKSEQKGTIPLLRTWMKHPEWPELTVITRRDEHLAFTANNINFITTFLSEDELIKMINEHGIHLCPSESEGFGHNIVEAMSVGAVVLTTNAPPMNELIHPDERCLVNYNKTDKRYFSELFFIDEKSIELKIDLMLETSIEQKMQISKINKKNFYGFSKALSKNLNKLTATF
jgi:glycosyltransferase involved in cell wall biosynthesis